MPAIDIHPPRNSPAELLIRQRRTRRILKWVGTCGCTLTLAAAAVCLQFNVFSTFGTWGIGLWDGAVALYTRDDDRAGIRVSPALRSAARWRVYGCWFRSGPLGDRDFVTIPLWIPFVAIAAPTIWLWRRDWGAAPSSCCPTCHYDLTGNATGICSECGQTLERPQ